MLWRASARRLIAFNGCKPRFFRQKLTLVKLSKSLVEAIVSSDQCTFMFQRFTYNLLICIDSVH